MNTMNMPGFTAESSLWNTTGRHYIGVSRALLASSGAVSPIIPSIRNLPPILGGYRPPIGGYRPPIYGFWCEAACVTACGLLAPELIAECVLACAWACD